MIAQFKISSCLAHKIHPEINLDFLFVKRKSVRTKFEFKLKRASY